MAMSDYGANDASINRAQGIENPRGQTGSLRRRAAAIAAPITAPVGQAIRVFCWGALTLTAIAATSGVAADSLAQPPEATLESQAVAYVQFRQDVEKIEAIPFTSAETTREAHRLLTGHDANDLTVGWMAYAALIAADTEEFKEAIEDRVKSSRRVRGSRLQGRDALLAELGENPSYGRQLEGAQAAIERVLKMTVADGARIVSLGEAFKQQAYAMQKTSWGKARISPAQTRLSEAHAFAAGRSYPTSPTLPQSDGKGVATPSLASLPGDWSPEWGSENVAGPADATSDAVMDRVLNLAVRYSIGALNPKIIEVYAQNRKANQCLSMSALTLNQCIAATRTPYEEAFCLGEHGLNDVAECIGWVAGPVAN
ncbi:MAG: hypothetical protein GC152_03255 [Alphaproteobacteria bacterium]|nr:hypothetical protein [Alphaproteobacteria bacterium]